MSGTGGAGTNWPGGGRNCAPLRAYLENLDHLHVLALPADSPTGTSAFKSRRWRMRRLLGAALIVTAASAEAEPAAVTGEALRELVTGKTVNLDTPYGNLPVTFRADGMMSGKAGVLALYLGSTTDRGRWSIKGDRICQKFFKWFDGETHCLTVRQDGRKITWRRDDGLSGTATIAANDAAPPPPPSGLGLPPAVEREAQVEMAMPRASAAVQLQPQSWRSDPAGIDPQPLPQLASGKAPARGDHPMPPRGGHTMPRPERLAPPRMTLASLHSAPAMPAPAARSPRCGRTVLEEPAVSPTLSPKSVAEEMLAVKAAHSWSLAWPASSEPRIVPGTPTLMEIASGRTPASHVGATGCLMAIPPLPEIARKNLAGVAR